VGETSKISWTHATFNPWLGCTKVSPACTHCYAEVSTPVRRARAGGLELWGDKAARSVTSDSYWKQPHRWNAAAVSEGVRRRVFCSSLADVFEDRRDVDVHRARLWSLIELTPALDWLLLTKRPAAVNRLASKSWANNGWPANVWLGTTVENQQAADERIPHLLAVPARLRFLSIEPMLGPIHLPIKALTRTCSACGAAFFIGGPESSSPCPAHEPESRGCKGTVRRGIDWVIVGGESGPHARSMRIGWARSVKEQCQATGTKVFVKQLGAMPFAGSRFDMTAEQFRDLDANGWDENHDPVVLRPSHRKGGDMEEWPEDLRVQEVPEVS